MQKKLVSELVTSKNPRSSYSVPFQRINFLIQSSYNPSHVNSKCHSMHLKKTDFQIAFQDQKRIEVTDPKMSMELPLT